MDSAHIVIHEHQAAIVDQRKAAPCWTDLKLFEKRQLVVCEDEFCRCLTQVFVPRGFYRNLLADVAYLGARALVELNLVF